jgi:hypothetical protein
MQPKPSFDRGFEVSLQPFPMYSKAGRRPSGNFTSIFRIVPSHKFGDSVLSGGFTNTHSGHIISGREDVRVVLDDGHSLEIRAQTLQ